MTDEKKIDPKDEKEEKSEEEMNLEKIGKELEEQKNKAEEYLAGWKRALADYQNAKNEFVKQKICFDKLIKKDILLNFLPVIDGLEQAVKHVPVDKQEESWVEGFFQIKKNLENILKNLGMEKLSSVEKIFNPLEHEAVQTKSIADKEDDLVLEELATGYKLDGEIIRPTKVVVNKKD